ERQVARARDVAGRNPGTRIGLAALETGLAAGVDQGGVESGPDVALADDFAGAFRRLETRRTRSGLATLRRPAFRRPFLQAAVEDRDSLGAEMAQHEPAARGGADRRIVIDDDAVVAVDTERRHRLAEVLGRWEHVRRRMGFVRKLLHVEKARSGDMRGEEFGSGIAAAARHE